MADGIKVFILTGTGQATGISLPARVCFTEEEEAPRAGLGSGGASTQRGAGGGESLTLGRGHPLRFSGSLVVLPVSLPVCPELAFLLQKEEDEKGRKGSKTTKTI